MTELPILQPRTCGTCTLCCKLMAITEIQKPRREWCPHCTPGKGCGIYDKKPASCNDFECLYLHSDMPESLRPDRSHVVMFMLAERKQMAVHVDEKYSGAIDAPAIQHILHTAVASGELVTVQIGTRGRVMCTRESAPADIAAKLPPDIDPRACIELEGDFLSND